MKLYLPRIWFCVGDQELLVLVCGTARLAPIWMEDMVLRWWILSFTNECLLSFSQVARIRLNEIQILSDWCVWLSFSSAQRNFWLTFIASRYFHALSLLKVQKHFFSKNISFRSSVLPLSSSWRGSESSHWKHFIFFFILYDSYSTC